MAIQLSNQRYEEIKRIVVRMFVEYGVSCVPINGFEIAHIKMTKIMKQRSITCLIMINVFSIHFKHLMMRS